MANEDNNSLYNIPVAVVDNTGVGASIQRSADIMAEYKRSLQVIEDENRKEIIEREIALNKGVLTDLGGKPSTDTRTPEQRNVDYWKPFGARIGTNVEHLGKLGVGLGKTVGTSTAIALGANWSLPLLANPSWGNMIWLGLIGAGEGIAYGQLPGGVLSTGDWKSDAMWGAGGNLAMPAVFSMAGQGYKGAQSLVRNYQEGQVQKSLRKLEGMSDPYYVPDKISITDKIKQVASDYKELKAYKAYQKEFVGTNNIPFGEEHGFYAGSRKMNYNVTTDVAEKTKIPLFDTEGGLGRDIHKLYLAEKKLLQEGEMPEIARIMENQKKAIQEHFNVGFDTPLQKKVVRTYKSKRILPDINLESPNAQSKLLELFESDYFYPKNLKDRFIYKEFDQAAEHLVVPDNYKTLHSLIDAINDGTFVPSTKAVNELASYIDNMLEELSVIADKAGYKGGVKLGGSAYRFMDKVSNKMPGDLDLYVAGDGRSKHVVLTTQDGLRREATDINFHEIRRQQYAYADPYKYNEIMNDVATHFFRTQEIVQPNFPLLTLDQFDARAAAYYDLFMSNKAKHLDGRGYALARAPIEDLRKSIEVKTIIFKGDANFDVPKIDFTNVEDNLLFLENMGYKDKSLAYSPERMALAFEDLYVDMTTFSRRIKPYNSSTTNIVEYFASPGGIGGRAVLGEGGRKDVINTAKAGWNRISAYGNAEAFLTYRENDKISRINQIFEERMFGSGVSDEVFVFNPEDKIERAVFRIIDSDKEFNPSFYEKGYLESQRKIMDSSVSKEIIYNKDQFEYVPNYYAHNQREYTEFLYRRNKYNSLNPDDFRINTMTSYPKSILKEYVHNQLLASKDIEATIKRLYPELAKGEKGSTKHRLIQNVLEQMDEAYVRSANKVKKLIMKHGSDYKIYDYNRRNLEENKNFFYYNNSGLHNKVMSVEDEVYISFMNIEKEFNDAMNKIYASAAIAGGASLIALLYSGFNHESPSERRHNNQIREDDDINNNED